MYPIDIERGKIREFARATMSTNPVFDGPEPVMPPTFLTTAGHLWEPESEEAIASLGFDVARMLHGEEEFSFHGPLPRAGARLMVRTRVADRFEKTGTRGGLMQFGVVIHEFLDESSVVVATQRSTIIETAKE